MEVYYVTIVAVTFSSFLSQLSLTERFEKHSLKNKETQIKNRLLVWFTGVVLILVSGLRWGVGTDYWQYSRNYNYYVQDVWEDFRTLNEPGLKLIAKLASLVNDDYVVMFFLAAVVTVGLVVWTISKYSNAFAFSILLYIFSGSWHGSFNIVRQFLAGAILFAGHRYIVERKFIKYMLVVAIASLFHISALAMIVLYFIPNRKLKPKEIVFLIGIMVLITLSYDYVFGLIESMREGSMADSDYANRQINILRIVISAAPLSVYFLMTDKRRLSDSDHFYVNVMLVNTAIWLMGYNSAYLVRFAIYTDVFAVLAYPRILRFNHKYIEILVKTAILVLFFIYWYIEVSGVPDLRYYRWIFDRY